MAPPRIEIDHALEIAEKVDIFLIVDERLQMPDRGSGASVPPISEGSMSLLLGFEPRLLALTACKSPVALGD